MSHTNIRMGGCSTGRSTQKYTGGGGGADLSSILAAHGDMIYADSNIEAANVSIGQTTGHVLTVISPGEVGWQAVSGATGTVGNLEQVTTNGPTTTQFVSFLNTATSLSASGNVVVSGNVTASKFIGSGLELSGVALKDDLTDNVGRISDLETANGVQENLITEITTDLSSNVTRITSLESNALMTSSSTLGPYNRVIFFMVQCRFTFETQYSLSGTVLTVVNASGTLVPSWQSPGGGSLWSQDVAKLYYTGGPVGIGNTAALTNQTLQIGSNVSISDTGTDKLTVAGNVHIARNLKVVDQIDVYMLRANFVDIKNINVVAERPRKS